MSGLDPTRPPKGAAGAGERARGFLGNLGKVRRRVGLAGTIELLLARTAPRWLAYERTSLIESPPIGELRPELRPRLLTAAEPAVDELYAALAVTGEPEVPAFSPSTVRQRFAAGHELWLFHHDGRPVHARWLAKDRYRFAGHSVAVPAGYRVTEAIATLPEFRGRMLHVHANGHLRAVTGQNGLRGLLSAINGFNRRLLNATLSPANGAKRVATVHALSIAGRQWLRLVPERGSGTHLRAEDLGVPVGRWVAGRRFGADPGPGDWDRAVVRALDAPYLDPRMAQVKREAHLALLERWLGGLEGAAVLKTDLWEEGVTGDELLFTLARSARSAAGVDVSEEATARAAEAAARAGIAVSLESADLASLPFGDDAMDVVVSTSTLDHLAPGDRLPALVELHRVLAPGGVLVVTCDNSDNVGDRLLSVCSRLGLVPFPLEQAVSLAELRDLVSRAGFIPGDHAYLVPGPRVLTTAAVRAARMLGRERGDRAVGGLMSVLDAAGRRWPRRTGAFVALRAVAGPGAGR